ncbi:MAG: FUSC family protein, partial [Bradyrhizobiaceae bacterium]|nr:FUSC family protein [Bradyrhizobiaceae bacterium]
MSFIATAWRSLRAQPEERRAQLRLALRIATAALLSLIVSQLLHLPMPLWTILTSILLTQVSVGRSLKATIDYLVGTLFGAVYGGAVVTLVPHGNEIEVAAVLVLVVAPLALLGAINPRFTTSPFTGVLVLMVPGMLHTSPIESAFYRSIEVAVGGAVAVAVSLVVLPARAHALAIEAAA